ncbi:hypothetical protein [Flavobacterium columnare]|uniref:hypothetical protein n=1 Tax=Flavobacterium columnare TaxID=996 RepID=UPI001CE0AA9D|nr:hypothetical protein [Flavobacterium columnare]
MPGNGYATDFLIVDYQCFIVKYIARVFWKGLEILGVTKLFAIVGRSLRGGIAWEMAFLKPTTIGYLIPIASNWKADDWLIGNVKAQENILNN